MMTEKKGRGFFWICLVICLLIVFLLQRLFMPKYTGSVVEGNFTAEYYRDDTPHDLLILGNCESYENISPMKLWEEYGITSYIRGNANQLIPQAYYLLKEALKKETPKAVLLNVQAMTIAEQETEEYNRMVFDTMRWSKEKLDAILATKTEEERLIDYIFPILRYHARWSDLTADDVRYLFGDRPVASYNGYYLRADIRPYTEFPLERRQADYSFSEKNTEYLEKIADLCEEQGIALILMKAPSLYPTWVEPYEEQITAFAQAHGLTYLNTLSASEEIGIDMSTDTYDEGLHLNVYGAEKLSHWLGPILQEAFGLADHRSDAALAAVYNERLAAYEAEKAAQKAEFEQIGYISKYRNIQE